MGKVLVCSVGWHLPDHPLKNGHSFVELLRHTGEGVGRQKAMPPFCFGQLLPGPLPALPVAGERYRRPRPASRWVAVPGRR